MNSKENIEDLLSSMASEADVTRRYHSKVKSALYGREASKVVNALERAIQFAASKGYDGLQLTCAIMPSVVTFEDPDIGSFRLSKKNIKELYAYKTLSSTVWLSKDVSVSSSGKPTHRAKEGPVDITYKHLKIYKDKGYEIYEVKWKNNRGHDRTSRNIIWGADKHNTMPLSEWMEHYLLSQLIEEKSEPRRRRFLPWL